MLMDEPQPHAGPASKAFPRHGAQTACPQGRKTHDESAKWCWKQGGGASGLITGSLAMVLDFSLSSSDTDRTDARAPDVFVNDST